MTRETPTAPRATGPEGETEWTGDLLSHDHSRPDLAAFLAGLRRRRAASRRLPVLEHLGRSDPWSAER